jgi:signal transduction histidine kinase
VGGALEIAERQGKRLSKLIDNLFEVARVQGEPVALRLERIDLSALVRRLGERLQPELAQAGCALRLSADTPVFGRWDRLRVEQIVSNLIANAAKYGAGRPIDVRVFGDDGRARIEVADHGIGIPREEQARIFDRFERGVSAWNYGGLGLGLFIARQLVQALGGSVAVQSEPGAGAVFTVELPMEGPRPLPMPELAAPGGSQ